MAFLAPKSPAKKLKIFSPIESWRLPSNFIFQLSNFFCFSWRRLLCVALSVHPRWFVALASRSGAPGLVFRSSSFSSMAEKVFTFSRWPNGTLSLYGFAISITMTARFS